MSVSPETVALIERTMAEHAPLERTYSRIKHADVDRCTCGTQHPTFDDGRWPTHRAHVAAKIAEALDRQPAATS